jgi:hypothetical protein
MATELRWLASLSASALAAAEAILSDRKFADEKLAVGMKDAAGYLASTIDQSPTNPAQLLPHLVALSAGIHSPAELAQVALSKVTNNEMARHHATSLGDAVRQVIAAFRALVPDVLEQLELRAEPIRQQWEARGGGLLANLRRLTVPELMVDQADVILIYPIVGGDGRAFLPYNSVLLEAVLADPIHGLPEVLRLAWLVAQLNCDLPKFQGELTRDQLAETAELAMLCPTLEAAQDVELARLDEPTLKLAIDSWCSQSAATIPELPATLQDWWNTCQTSRPDWDVAIAALGQMIAPRIPGDRTSN